MGYVFRPFLDDLVSAEPPQLSPFESDSQREHRLMSVFLGTCMSVPCFRTRVMAAAGLSEGPMSRASVLQDVKLTGHDEQQENGEYANSMPDGLIRVSGPMGLRAMLIEAKRHDFSASDARHVRQLAKHLAQAKHHKIQKVVTLASLAPSAEFLHAVADYPMDGSVDKVRPLTWMMTVDIAYHLLESRKARSAAEVYLLEQYIRYIKEEAVRDRRAKTGRPEGAIYFNSLGRDWEDMACELLGGGEIDARDPRLAAVVMNWIAYVRFLSMTQTRSALRDEDTVVFPNVKARDPLARIRQIAKKLRDTKHLTATLRKRSEASAVTVGVDLQNGTLHYQIEVGGPSGKNARPITVRELAGQVRTSGHIGDTRIKIFWPGEKQAREVSLAQALGDHVATAPPQHGEVPERFMVEHIVECGALFRRSDSFVQLVTGEFRAFRASVRHLLRRGVQ